MSYILRATYCLEVVVDELPLDAEPVLLELIEDGSADLALLGEVSAECLCCGLDARLCACVSDDEDARAQDNAQRARDAA